MVCVWARNTGRACDEEEAWGWEARGFHFQPPHPLLLSRSRLFTHTRSFLFLPVLRDGVCKEKCGRLREEREGVCVERARGRRRGCRG